MTQEGAAKTLRKSILGELKALQPHESQNVPRGEGFHGDAQEPVFEGTTGLRRPRIEAFDIGRHQRSVADAAALLALVPAAQADPFFPNAGNLGYDVARYRLDLQYEPATRTLTGRAEITARARDQLSTFHLDLRGLNVHGVTVHGRAASFRRQGQELIITPSGALRAGGRFTTVVDYGGVPGPVIDADGSRDGWIPTDDGAFVAGEPQGAPTWFPANDAPADKATSASR